MRQSSLVVVANRLPVDDSCGARRRLRMAPQPRRSGQRAAPDPAAHPAPPGSAGPASTGPAPDLARPRRRTVARRPADREDVARPLRGLRQLHALAALPRRGRAARLPPAVVGGLPAGQPAIRRGGRRGGRARARLVWVQDYHLQLVPGAAARPAPDLRIGFFLHVPFPPPELFMQLPRRAELLLGMLGADLVGFQRPQAAHNFAQLASQACSAPGDRPADRGRRPARAGRAPSRSPSTSAEMEALAAPAGRGPSGPAQLRDDLGEPQQVILERRPAGLHQGHRAAAQGVQRAAADGHVRSATP